MNPAVWGRDLRGFFKEGIWAVDLKALPSFKRFFYRPLKIGAIVYYGYQRNNLPIRATALAYTILLSLVPFLAVSFSLFKAFGGLENAMEPVQNLILSNLSTGAGTTVVEHLNQFIENYRSGTVGVIGFFLLILSLVSLLSSIEKAFNDIWGISKSRTFIRRFTTYWTLITIGPVLLGLSLTMTGALQSNQLITQVLSLSGYQQFFISKIPWLVTWGLFTVLYLVMPNTQVRFGSALVGGIVGGSFWEVAKWGYALYASKVVTYSAVYGSLGIIPIFLVWIYYTWLVVLIGAQITYANQNIYTFKPAHN
ncbi:MAG: YihY family inner membrane protein [Deltaproteobacteria bacterium]|nr:YihY family inner membrane protein [Deltaproteobacteria bacterium]